MNAESPGPDVVVVGGGNAGFCAAHAAAEHGRRVVLLEAATRDLAGGNSYYTAGATRMVHAGLDDLRDVVEPDERHPTTTVPPYSAADFTGDLEKVTEGRNDPRMTEIVVGESSDTVRWLAGKGVRYRLMYERQAYARDDGYLFWGGLHVGNVNGGIGLIADHTRIAADEGVDVRYGHRVTGLLTDDEGVVGVRYTTENGEDGELLAASVVLTSGGFESSATMREEHLGPGWARAKVRGTPYNTGELLLAALELGATRGGDWSTCHSVAWDALAEHNESNRELTNRLTRQSYPLGIVVNSEGRRFVDEGADFRNYTYAKYGREILRQPGSIAYQIFDADLRPLLRSEEYDMPGVSVVQADSLEELARDIIVDPAALAATVKEFNASIEGGPLDPTVKDGRRAVVTPPKSNWASPIATAPFYAYPVTCGITFTFGGLRGDDDGRVLRPDGSAIPGLFAAGEALGGLFSGNYPGGSGLTAGMVFGRRAGSVA
ncbi:MAG TPA: FAD-dependent tricarballylate dehydrogenase TcuA [Actinomycetospora sp.]|uniref:FAD-dependent tricarballylate dehydrogenase TcuA n=1 Tax=Actinomycetospora sp. TaxID=1872135 RepID=UPI002F3FC3D8